MPEFHADATTTAPIEKVWKLLVDPARYPEWWAGIAAIDQRRSSDDTFTLYRPDEPEPWPQQIEQRSGDQLIVSCMTSAMRYDWRLSTADDETRVDVHVEIPDEWSSQLDPQRDLIAHSLTQLTALAERTA